MPSACLPHGVRIDLPNAARMALPDFDGRTRFAFGPHAGEGLMIELTGDSLGSFRLLDPAGFRERCACAGRWFCETGCAIGRTMDQKKLCRCCGTEMEVVAESPFGEGPGLVAFFCRDCRATESILVDMESKAQPRDDDRARR